jgi:hypothetical protein
MALLKLPKDLDETYERCLQRVAEKQQQYSLRVLRYVYEAKLPLTIDALGEALATDPDTGELNYDHIPVHTAILRSGANLIVFDEVERLVIPAHHSVREFLDSSKASILEELELPVLDDAVLHLGEMCIAHLVWHTSDPDPERMKRPGESPSATRLSVPSIERMSNYIKPPDQKLSRLMASWFPKRQQATTTSTTSRKAPVVLTLPVTRNAALRLYRPFHIYARSNWVSLSRKLTKESTSWPQFERLVHLGMSTLGNKHDRGDSQMFPWKSDSPSSPESKILGWAIYNGHLGLLELGIRRQQNLTMPLYDYDGLLPLHLAAKRGFIDVFDKVHAWPLDMCPKTGRTALHYAAEHGHPEILRHLLQSAKPLNIEAVEVRDREGRTPFGLAITSGSLKTVEVISSLFDEALWKYHPTNVILSALVTGGSRPDIVDYVVERMNLVTRNREDLSYRDASILCWVHDSNAISLLSSLVKIGVSLDTELDSKDIVNDIPQVKSPVIFFTLEASTSAKASAFIDNGANIHVEHYLRRVNGDRRIERWGKLYPIDLILSRGWTLLASTILPSMLEYKSYGKRKFSLRVMSKEVYWISVLMVDWIITGVVCGSHAPCNFATQLGIHQRFLFAKYRYTHQSHPLTVTIICPDSNRPDPQFKLMMGTQRTSVSDWRVGPTITALDRLPRTPPWMPLGIGTGESDKFLDFNRNPYNLQLIRISGEKIQCSSDMSSWGIQSGENVQVKWDEEYRSD